MAQEDVVLTKLTPRGNDCQLQISGLDKPLVVPVDTIHRYRLVESIVLTPSQLATLQTEAARLACDRKASRLLSSREHSVGELKLKLSRAGYQDDTVAEIVAKYRRLGLLDDTRFARMVAESSLKRNPSGRAYLVSLLQKKLVPRTVAERTVSSVMQGLDEVDLAVQSLRKRWSSFSQLELERARQKAYNYLSRRGLGYAAAKAAFEKLCSEKQPE